MDYRREIDGLRALAVLPVILFHAGFESFSGGFVGVDVFFVISGYLITTIILAELEQGKFSIVNFYERRARRILPALFVVMLFCIPFAWFLLLPQDLLSFSKTLVSTSAFISNIFFWSERGYFGTATELKPLIHTWSLAIEEQYYLLFPLLLMIFFRSKYLRNTALVILFVISFGLCIWLTPVHQDSAFFLLPTRFWELLVGSFVAIYLFEFSKNNEASTKYLDQFFGFIGLCLILFSVFYFDKKTLFPGYSAFIPVLGTALIIVFGTSRTYVGKILGFKALVFVGLLSYSAYLWHQPFLSFLRHSEVKLTATVSFVAVAATFLISYFTWKYVEQPWRSKAFSRRIVFTFGFAGLLMFSLFGLLGVLNKGFVERYSKEDVPIFNNFNNAGDYVSNRFDKLKLAPFDLGNKSQVKILVIGDSYGKDLVNAIYESSLIDRFQLSTHQINSECGNLYLEEDFTDNIEISRLPRCRVLGWYKNQKLTDLINQSDQIWLASSWSTWVGERLPKSIENLEKKFDKPVVVFGTKNFGDVSIKSLLSIPIEDRSKFRGTVNPSSFEVQEFMRNSLKQYRFVDLGVYLCGDDIKRCRLFNDGGEPLSFDGEHLTKAGAKLLGEGLVTVDLIK